MTKKSTNTNTILKHDQLQALSSKFTTIDEQRFLNSCLSDNWQRVQFSSSGYYPVNISNYASKRNIGLGKAYSEIKKHAQDFTRELRVLLATGETWVTRIIYDYKFNDEELTLSIRFNKDLIPYISGDMVNGTFYTYDERLDSKPSNRRYIMSEILQRNLWALKRDGKFVLTIPEIRFGLNLKETEYKVYGALYKRVIKETLKDFADIRGEYILSDKKPLGIVFTKVTKEEFYEKI